MSSDKLTVQEREDTVPMSELHQHHSHSGRHFKTYFLILLVVIFSPLGNVLLSSGMKQVPLPNSSAFSFGSSHRALFGSESHRHLCTSFPTCWSCPGPITATCNRPPRAPEKYTTHKHTQ